MITVVTYLEKKIDKLFVMDDASGLADKSNDFSNFLNSQSKIWLYLFVYFSHPLSVEISLVNDTFSNYDF